MATSTAPVKSSTSLSQQETPKSVNQHLWDRTKTPLHWEQREFCTVLDSRQVRAYIRTKLLTKEFQENPTHYVADWGKRHSLGSYPQSDALKFFIANRHLLKVE